MFAVYMMKKFWKSYYLSSDGAGLSVIDLRNNELRACAYYDILTCSCLSTGSLHVYSDGCYEKRFEKTKKVAEFSPAYDQLHVCVSDTGKNCGKCIKCKRTLLTLDALQSLDKFSKVFDVEYYRNRKSWYLAYLYAQHLMKKDNDNMVDGNDMKQVYDHLKDQIRFGSKVQGAVQALRTKLSRNSIVKKIYSSVRGKKSFTP